MTKQSSQGMDNTEFDLCFKDVTLGVFLRACTVAGVSANEVIRNPFEAMSAVEMSPEKAQAFCDAVLAEPLNLRGLTPDQADAVAAYIAADFFCEVYRDVNDEKIHLMD